MICQNWVEIELVKTSWAMTEFSMLYVLILQFWGCYKMHNSQYLQLKLGSFGRTKMILPHSHYNLTGQLSDISFCYTCTHTSTKGEAPVND